MSCAVALVGVAARLEQPDLEHLARVVPLVDRRVDVEALVALEADQPGPERRGEHLGELRLADAGLTLEQQRPSELEREEDGRRERAVGDVVAAAEVLGQRLDRARAGGTVVAIGSGGRSSSGCYTDGRAGSGQPICDRDLHRHGPPRDVVDRAVRPTPARRSRTRASSALADATRTSTRRLKGRAARSRRCRGSRRSSDSLSTVTCRPVSSTPRIAAASVISVAMQDA